LESTHQWVVEGNQDDFAGVVAWVVHDVLAVGVLQKARFLANLVRHEPWNQKLRGRVVRQPNLMDPSHETE
jgi:hypothetical protein